MIYRFTKKPRWREDLASEAIVSQVISEREIKIRDARNYLSARRLLLDPQPYCAKMSDLADLFSLDHGARC